MTEPVIAAEHRKPISPAFAVLVCMWALALLVLFALGREARSEAWQDLLIPVVLFGLMAATRYLNPTPAGDFPCPAESSSRVGLQLLVIAAIALLTGFQYLANGGIPVWGALANVFARIGTHTPAGALGVTNFAQYALVPGIAVLALGARFGQIGFGRFGPSPLRVAVAWLLLPVAALGYAVYLVMRLHKPAWFILGLFVQNLFQNGISEEFLWRGLLLTRMRKFLGDDWANLLQAILFGAWHFRHDYASAHGHLAYAASAMIASQAVFGYAMGWLFLKTRNLAIPAVFHAAFDTLGAVFG
jgi:membrane protease YdiL (CAAX protease family)